MSRPPYMKSSSADCATSSGNDGSIEDEAILTQYISTRKKLRRGSEMDVTADHAMWNRIIKNSFLGSGILNKVAICNVINGQLMGFQPDDFCPTTEQVKILGAAIFKPSSIAGCGILLCDMVFRYSQGQVGQSVTGISEDGETEVLIKVGKTKAIIAVYDSNCHDDANTLVSELCTYFVSNNVFI